MREIISIEGEKIEEAFMLKIKTDKASRQDPSESIYKRLIEQLGLCAGRDECYRLGAQQKLQ